MEHVLARSKVAPSDSGAGSATSEAAQFLISLLSLAESLLGRLEAPVEARCARLDALLHLNLFGTLLRPLEPKDLLSVVALESGATVSESISFWYERLYLPSLDHHHANRHGIFYTPPAVAKNLVRELSLSSAAMPCHVLDPACGTGIFLAVAFKQLLADSRSTPEGAIQFLYGVDLDPLAVELTKLSLLLEYTTVAGAKTSYPDLSTRILRGNTLLDDTASNETLLPLDIKERFPEVTARGGFDVVLGNPPYGLSRDEQMSHSERIALKHRYRHYEIGKANKYLLFILRGLELLRPSGVLSFIVPNAWLGISSAVPIRKALLNEGGLSSITLHHQEAFPELGVETLTFIARKGCAAEALTINDPLREKRMKVPLARCRARPDCTITTRWSAVADEVFRLLEKITTPLGDPDSPFTSLIALQAYAVGKGTPPQSVNDVRSHVFHSPLQVNSDHIRYLEGGDISRYGLEWSGAYLHYGPWLAEPQTRERFQGPRVLLREVLGKPPYLLHATFTDESYLYNKSVLHILPKRAGASMECKALLAIMNSVFASFIVLHQGKKSQRALFPKIVNADLREFPLPHRFSAGAPRLAALVDARLASRCDCATLDLEIDEEILALYGIPSARLASIRESLLDS